MRNGRVKTGIAIVCALAGISGAGVGFLRANAEEQGAQDALVAPVSYEQYLALSAPSDLAVSEDYTAIADGNAVYLYDRTDGEYRRYEHTVNQDPSMNKITKLQFDDNDSLYLLDAYNFLYVIEESAFDAFSTATPTDTGLACSTFTLHGEWLYFTNVTSGAQLSKVSTENLDKNSARPLLARSLAGTPALCFWEGELYFTDESFSTHLYKIDPDSGEFTEVCRLEHAVSMMTVTEGIFACSFANGAFFAKPIVSLNTDAEEAYTKAGSYSAVCALDAFVYTIEGTSVRQFDVESTQFTEFEICANSNSPTRLNGASDIHLDKDKLYIADAGNNRVSVYDTKSGAFIGTVKTLFAPSYITAHGDLILIADGVSIALYKTDGTLLSTFAEGRFTGEIKGVASVYGNFYIVTDQNRFYLLETGETPVLTESVKTSTRYPKLLTTDANGFLYIVSGNDVFRFTEETFLDQTQIGEEVYQGLPAETRKIALDYEQALYALTNDRIYSCNKDTTVTFDSPLVYYADGAPSVTAFTLGIEENATYAVMDGNYILATPRLDLPTVKTIAVENADEKVFADTSAEFTVLQTAQNALLVEFDLTALQGAETFPYLAYTRETRALTALGLASTDSYEVIAVFDETANAYRTYLARKDDCTALATDVYRKDYAETEQTTAYLTNAVGLYKFPYLSALLTVETLPRGAQVTVLGEIDELDHEYYHIAYNNAQGERVTGYIPKVYANDFDGSPKQSQTSYHGDKKSNRDELWRLAYLILGFLAVCILTDCLILHKHKEE